MAIQAIVFVTLVGGQVTAHDQAVRQALLDNCDIADADAKYSSELPVSNSIQIVINHAASIGAILVRPYSNGQVIQQSYNTRYPDTLIVNAMENDAGTNAHTENTKLSGLGQIVFVGAGVSGATENQTAYGFGLEFWDVETYGSAGSAESSYATGVVAGKLLTIKNELSCSWSEAREAARTTASNAMDWSKFNGFGRIDVDRAISSRQSVEKSTKVNGMSVLRGAKIGSRYLPDLIK